MDWLREQPTTQNEHNKK